MRHEHAEIIRLLDLIQDVFDSEKPDASARIAISQLHDRGTVAVH